MLDSQPGPPPADRNLLRRQLLAFEAFGHICQTVAFICLSVYLPSASVLLSAQTEVADPVKSFFIIALAAGTLGATAELSWTGFLSEHVQLTALGGVLLLLSVLVQNGPWRSKSV